MRPVYCLKPENVKGSSGEVPTAQSIRVRLARRRPTASRRPPIKGAARQSVGIDPQANPIKSVRNRLAQVAPIRERKTGFEMRAAKVAATKMWRRTDTAKAGNLFMIQFETLSTPVMPSGQ